MDQQGELLTTSQLAVPRKGYWFQVLQRVRELSTFLIFVTFYLALLFQQYMLP